MYNIKMNSSKAVAVVGWIFIVIGLIWSAIMFFLVYSPKTFFKHETIPENIEWRIDQDGEYHAKVTYEYKKKEYQCEPSASSTSKFKIKRIYFDDNNHCMVPIKDLFGPAIYAFYFSAFVFLGLGGGLVWSYYKQKKKIEALKTGGILVKNIDCETKLSSMFINGQRMYQITTNYTFPDGTTKILRQFRTPSPGEEITENKCDLLYLPDDYKTYYLDFHIN